MDGPDATRLNQLVEELTSDPAYAAGRRRFRGTVTGDDAIAIASALQEEVDAGVEVRARSAARAGMVLACRRGCNGCCEEPIMVYRPEAAQVAAWLELPDNAAAREAFLAAYPEWKERVGDTPARLSALFPGDPAASRAAHVEGWRKRVMCAFNRGGDCSIYPVRPITCRNGHALDTSEHCHGGSEQPAARVVFAPLDQFIARTRALLAAAHNAVGGPSGRVEALCDAVHEMLTG